MLNLELLKLRDKLVVTRDGQEHIMEVYSLTAPGDMGRRFSAGPRVGAWIRPGGYSVNFDYETLKSGTHQVRALTDEDCEEFIADGSCIHSDCMGKAGM